MHQNFMPYVWWLYEQWNNGYFMSDVRQLSQSHEISIYANLLQMPPTYSCIDVVGGPACLDYEFEKCHKRPVSTGRITILAM